MGVYTKGGDKGMTDLFGMQRVPKDHVKVEAYGVVDELNAVLGQVRAWLMNGADQVEIKWIQNRLITLCAQLAATEAAKAKILDPIGPADVETLEMWIDEMDKVLPKFTDWIIPGEDKASACLHLARTVTRRAERAVTSLSHEEPVSEQVCKFLNRLSDYLFQKGRKVEHDMDVQDILRAVEKKLSGGEALELAGRIADRAQLKAGEIDVPVTIVVTDASGHIILLRRMDGCLLGSIDIAQSKAKSSVLLRMSTEELGKLVQPGQPLYGIEHSNNGLTPFGGGLPIWKDGVLWGGLGISGGSVDEDIVIALAGLEVL